MGTLNDLLAAFGIKLQTACFAFIGSLLAVLRHRECTWQENIVSFLGGLSFALVTPGFVIHSFSLPQDVGYLAGLGFVSGYFGMSVMDEATAIIKSPELRQRLLDFLPRKGG